MVADVDVADTFADGAHDAGTFMAEHLRQRQALFVILHPDVCMADATGANLDEHLPRAGRRQRHRFQRIGGAAGAQHGGGCRGRLARSGIFCLCCNRADRGIGSNDGGIHGSLPGLMLTG